MGRTAKTDQINLVCFSWHVERRKEKVTNEDLTIEGGGIDLHMCKAQKRRQNLERDMLISPAWRNIHIESSSWS